MKEVEKLKSKIDIGYIINYLSVSLAIFIIFCVVLLGFMYPLIPKTLNGWLAFITLAVFLLVWILISIYLIKWLDEREKFKFFYKFFAVLVAISLGLLIFIISVKLKYFIGLNFTYFH